ncbi:OsmC family protein [Ponticoccus sp. SC2-23]|uniref:OsmC family protein n=1 Tax=Alexandriicola marinus TaxID=2081710 RepID=UPI000FD8E3A3|nr:OsmC family protein [Alexandriicola marinus]MBM1220883.1 OsmC family protein [Ponticoccus sp. SC6-9]MBM1225453.1 OsmC family protein [Ponticoccus sp. SC6-15]MBM1227636.1 OsmC family protein [Ponticoccus sp. SC6-38]MBM1234726.1 OsmC family protein [Ponticoccus sp. SC6-45]MBM1238138.1 OsmC family protein [Ponticoccus sp. SC6-49]MBM1244229.1 OsmC family protein [Ponticoccus sp. SC2-64]MBM1248250.1 OsmC family protein [Ponticoccus sp. SC6-42]MBM1252538.1 OsmC family protein [Ponticoccus sp. 
MEVKQPKTVTEVTFTCHGQANGKMRNDLDVSMISPMEEHFTLATDEGPFHGGDATAPPPLALFIGGLTGCIMTQLRAFAKRMDVTITDLKVDCRVTWVWTPKGRIYETAPKSFDIDVILDSPNPIDAQLALIAAAKKGCFVEQTLGQVNSVRHRLKTVDGFVDAD